MPPLTVGEKVDRDGPCALMMAVANLAQAYGRIPVGVWQVELEPGWELRINGTASPGRLSLPPFNAAVLRDGLPIVIFDAAGGIQVGAPGPDGSPEDVCLAVMARALATKQQETPNSRRPP